MNKLIRSHKKVNDNAVVLGSEATAIAFYKLTKLYNEQMEYKNLELTKQSLWELSGYSGKYNSIKLNALIKELTNSKTFDISSLGIGDIKSISGSIFVTTIYNDGRIVINVPEPYRHLLFYKRDINLMHKAKQKEKMSIEDIDYYEKEVKQKSKFLVLLNEADLLNVKGKYNKRIYALLKQWDYIGKYEKNWQEFKEILEIPKSYKSSDIDKKILNKIKIELLKVNIEITDIEKVKKGRSIDKIIIRFKNLEKLEDKKEVIKVEELKALSPEEVLVEKTLTKLFLKMNGYTLRDLGDIDINNELREFIEENK